MSISTIKRTSLVSLGLLVVACAAEGPTEETTEDFAGVGPETGDLTPQGKADGEDVSVVFGNPYDRIDLSGSAAADLFDALGSASGVTESTRNGLTYRYGYFSICASNGAAEVCNIYTRDATTGFGDYAATLHGQRFSSAASEVFGVLAARNGVAPASVNVVEHGRLLCEKTTQEVWCGVEDSGGATAQPELSVRLQNLGDLGPDYVYEGWLITSEGPIAAGRFNLTSDDETVTFAVDPTVAADSTAYVLTIEPAVGDDPAPSSVHVVAGNFNGTSAALDTTHPAALGADHTNAAGAFFLATPTTADNPNDNDLGVWFLDPTAGPGASLDLPPLPTGWTYEGWVVGSEGPVSTGTFLSGTGPDSDGPGAAAGPDAAPPFPGQDFINPPMSLEGAAVVISVEPTPDNSPAPFFLKPLVNGNAMNLGAGVLQSMTNQVESNYPTGTASFN